MQRDPSLRLKNGSAQDDAMEEDLRPIKASNLQSAILLGRNSAYMLMSVHTLSRITKPIWKG